MPLAFSTNAFTRFSLSEALSAIRSAGFSHAEILADVPHAYPDTLTPASAGAVRRDLDRLDLELSNINCNCSFGYWSDAPPEPYFEPSLISPNPRHRADRQRLVLRALEFAAAVGAPSLSITSGRCLGGMPPDRAAAAFAEGLRPLLDRADRLDVNLGVECEPGLFVEYQSELLDWIDRLGSPRLGANLDIGHSVVLGESVDHAIQLMRGRIWNMHVEDLPGRKHYHMIPGTGTFDWPALKHALHAIAYSGPLTVELYTETENPHRAAEESHAFLSKLFA